MSYSFFNFFLLLLKWIFYSNAFFGILLNFLFFFFFQNESNQICVLRESLDESISQYMNDKTSLLDSKIFWKYKTSILIPK